jgi:hypothetical protein
MAKSKPKETSVPLIFALVFFVLTTIAFGVMWYLSYSDMEAKNAELKKKEDEKKPLRDEARNNELKARVYRAYMGIDEGDDKTVLAAEAKPGDVISTELDKINAAMAKKAGVAGAADLPDELKFWGTDATKKAAPPPAEGLVDQVAKLKNKDVAYKEAEKERDSYAKQIESMNAAITNLAKATEVFNDQVKKLPEKFQKDLKEVTSGFDTRTKLYVQNEASANKRITELTEEKDKLEGQLRRRNDLVTKLQEDNQSLLARLNSARGKGEFTYDEPQGKVLRKLPEGAVEIGIGSAAGVRPGLTFTVLPRDFPEKGKQSRMRMLRVPDGRGGFKSVEQFVPKGSLEVYEVVGPNLSLARVQAGSELDPIRDGISVGDLLYNSAWRKGVADHIALIGIFDVNGDGIDDIESVVRDLTKMGIPVDAYFDLKKKAWVGQVTERTRYIVEGYMPINSVTDPHRDEKNKLLESLSVAVKEGKQRGVDTVNFRDFFSRMGYKFRLDVTDDKINQATAPYLSNVGVGGPLMQPEP